MQEERKRILNMVKEGKLTVNEALVLLDELGKGEASNKEKDFFEEFSSKVKFEEAKKDDPFSQQKFHSAKEKIFDFVDLALKKIKDFDLDINFGQSVDIEHVFQQNDVYMKEMDIDLANGSVKILPWEKKDVRIDCEAKVYRVDSEEEARNSFLKDVVFAIEGQKMRFTTQQKWMKIKATIYIPQAQYDKVKVRMFNGPIECENLKVEKYNVKTANGKINMTGLESRLVEAETANGQIEVHQGNIDDFEAETINGSIKADGSFRKLELQSFNGNLECTLADNSCTFLEAKGTTGAIKLYVPLEVALAGEAKSNLGNFNIDYTGVQITEEKSEVIQKLVRFEPKEQAEQVTRVDLDTKTGSVTVRRMR